MEKLVHVLNRLRSGAIPHIIRDLQPYMKSSLKVEIVSLEPVVRSDSIVKELGYLDIVIHDLNCSRRNVVKALFRLRNKLKEITPSVIHAHTGRAELLSPICAPRGTPVFATSHSVKNGYRLYARVLIPMTDRLLYKRLFVSHAVAESWRGDNYDRDLVIYNPVSAQRFSVKQDNIANMRADLAPFDHTLFLCVGRLVGQKGHIDLIRAVKIIKDKGQTKFCVIIAGRGPLESFLISETERLGLSEYVRFLGFRDDIPSLLAASDVFVFPSHWEGLGIAALEAMASGKPVIASDLPAIREYISSGESGLLYPPEDIASLSVHMMEAMNNPAGLNKIAQKGLYVCDYFSPAKLSSQSIETYRKALI